jgi:hypothetical protein
VGDLAVVFVNYTKQNDRGLMPTSFSTSNTQEILVHDKGLGRNIYIDAWNQFASVKGCGPRYAMFMETSKGV